MTSRVTDLFVGDWSQLLIGQRLELSIQTLTKRYAELGQVGIVANWRGDVQPARPRAFSGVLGLQVHPGGPMSTKAERDAAASDAAAQERGPADVGRRQLAGVHPRGAPRDRA